MTRPSANEIRQQFIDYFAKKHGHTFVPSSPCVPADDPTLMFTNAGMNQFKDVFLATGTRSYSRAANSQKCIRAGGKHNDLDDVGHDTYHHTFFEMLGNWSFGDYFKAEAIAWAWDLLTNVWGLEKDRLHATYFEGDAAEGLEPDTEARDLWLKILPLERVHPGNRKDNLWEMGDTGPCGPCSEIHIDLTPDKSGGPLVNAGDARVIEIWNLVFIQFNRGADRKLTPLPAKHVDTGMGFERITAIIQGVDGNYATDLFAPIFAEISKVTGAAAYTGLLEDDASKPKADIMRDVAYRVIADHLRCLVFAISDGAVPDNEGRGYVLRRILRRAVRYGRQYLMCGTGVSPVDRGRDARATEPFLHKLVPVIADTMAGAFPELKDGAQRVVDIVLDEEASFSKTLDRGIALFEQAADYAIKHHRGRISGEDAFKLHDTYGFPVDLTELMAEERGLTVNIGEYERLMETARERSRIKIDSQLLGIPEEHLASVTVDRFKFDHPSKPLQATYLFPVAVEPSSVGFVFDRTCFYAEQGGQAGDNGFIEFAQGQVRVSTTIRARDQVIHVCNLQEHRKLTSALQKSQSATLIVDDSRRLLTMMNHTATHILNWALREVLGKDVKQKGSLVDPEKTRFDLSHPSAISHEELARIEDLVNKRIEADLTVYTGERQEADARRINTLRAVFGEKYPETVRIVSIGVPIDDLMSNPDNTEWMKFSVEFCGGTHLQRTGEAGRFRFIEESAVAKGIRRVVGVTGERAEAVDRAAVELSRDIDVAFEGLGQPLSDGRGSDPSGQPSIEQAVSALNTQLNTVELPLLEKNRLRGRLSELQEHVKSLKKQAAKSGTADILGRLDDLLAKAERLGDHAIIAVNMGQATIDQLRAASDALRSRAGSAAVFLASESEGKAVLLAAMTKDLATRGIKAGELMKSAAPIVGGRGGGRPDMAQGGGPDTEKIDEAVQHAAQWLRAAVAP